MVLKLKGLNNHVMARKLKRLPGEIEDQEIHKEGKDMEDQT